MGKLNLVELVIDDSAMLYTPEAYLVAIELLSPHAFIQRLAKPKVMPAGTLHIDVDAAGDFVTVNDKVA